MEGITRFEHEQFGTIRTTTIDGEPWFVAKDVCDALGIATNHVRESLDDDEVSNLRSTEIGPELGGKAPLIISEAGLYSLTLKSRKPEAKAFKRWITHEVLPAIRKTGGYMVARDEETPEELMARALTIANETLARRERRLRELEAENEAQATEIVGMKPKALFADAVATSDTSILVGEMAKILKQNGYDTGQQRLFETLRRDGFLIGGNRSDKNMPTQRSMEMGLFEIKERSIANPDGTTRVTKTPKITGRGQVYFVNRYCGRN